MMCDKSRKMKKQAVAQLCQPQVQFKLGSDLLGSDLYIFIQKLHHEVKTMKHKIGTDITMMNDTVTANTVTSNQVNSNMDKSTVQR